VRDHVVPWSYLTNQRRGSRTGYGHWTVPACVQCNVLLGNKMFRTMRERMEYLLQSLEKKGAEESRSRFLRRVIELQ
jgi:hypothetical protein